MTDKKNNDEFIRSSNEDLAEALLEVRELVSSGSESMGIIDEALGKVGISPWKKVRTQWWGRTGVQ